MSALPFFDRGFGVFVEGQRKADPVIEVALGLQRASIDVDEAVVWPTSHGHSVGALALQDFIVNGGIDTAHDAVSANGDTHFSLNHERNAAEHSLFFDVAHPPKCGFHSVR